MDMSVSCGSCGKKIQDYPVYCYMCDDDFCSDQCHMNRHNKQWQKFWYCNFVYKALKVRKFTKLPLNVNIVWNHLQLGILIHMI